MVRLEQLSTELVDALRRTSENRQRQAAIAACQFAGAHSNLQDPVFLESLRRLRERDGFSDEAQARIETLVAQMDDRYFDLYEVAEAKRETGEDGSAEEHESDKWFRQARAANCLLCAMGADAFKASTEAIYEAAATATTDIEVKKLLDVISSLCLPPE